MRIELKQPYLSIKQMKAFDLPDFAVLIGRNGVGKTQLLDAIANGRTIVSGLSKLKIRKFDINSFQPKHSGPASWGSEMFAERTVERYFLPSSGDALREVAENIFRKVLDDFKLADGTDGYREFEGALRKAIRRIQDFSCFEQIEGSDVLSAYSQKIRNDVIDRLRSKNTNSRRSTGNEIGSCGNDSAILVSLAMKLADKLPHELSRDDVLRAAHYEGHTIANQLSQAFTRYKVEQYSWAYTQGEEGKGSIQNLLSKYRQDKPPPWILLRENLVSCP